jgi:prepilin-type N-terminal cleavage/methylation domain-containing protein
MTTHRNRQFGFTLIEMVMTLAILSIVLGVVLRQIQVVQQRSQTEASKTDMTQQAREGLDEMIHDIHMAGYPNAKMYWSSALSSPMINDNRVAAGCDPSTGGCTGATSGLIKITGGTSSSPELWLEGDVDGDGVVDVVRYRYVTSATNGAAGTQCPCIERGWGPKLNADPVSSQAVTWSVLIENMTTSGFSIAAYDVYGATVNINSPLTLTANTTAIQSIRTVAITLSVKGSQLDMPTKQYPTVVLSGLGQFRN